MPISPCPDLDDLFWLFETEPVLAYDDLGWPVSEATWTTTRDQWLVACTISPYDRSVEIDCALDGQPVVHLKFRQNVDDITIDRARGAEALVVTFQSESCLDPLRLQLKPSVRVSGETRLPWEAPPS